MNLRSKKRWIAIGCGVVLVSLSLSLGRQASRSLRQFLYGGPARPVLAIDVTTAELGEVAAGQTLQNRFALRNVGTRRLVLNELDVTCGCRKNVRRTILVGPGETTEVTVPLYAERTGPTENRLYFTTNDSNRPEFVLVVRGRVTSGTAVNSRRQEERPVSIDASN
ncbi:MAG: hypothetical protein RIS70_3566 [Planctomycetota bacterium]|jgi:hypothetical protein